MYIFFSLDIALQVVFIRLVVEQSLFKAQLLMTDQWCLTSPLFKGHKEFTIDLHPPSNLTITEHSTNKCLLRREAVWAGNGGTGSDSKKSEWLYYLEQWWTGSFKNTNEGKVVWEHQEGTQEPIWAHGWVLQAQMWSITLKCCRYLL